MENPPEGVNNPAPQNHPNIQNIYPSATVGIGAPITPQPNPEHITTPASTPSGINTPDSDYVSNPFLNAVRGLILILQNNPVPALLSGLLGVSFYVIFEVLYFVIILAFKSPALILPFSLILLLVYLVILGSYFVIGGASARGEKITTEQAYGTSFRKLIPMIGLIIIMFGMSLSFVLFIIPGFYVMARSSLSFLILIEEDLGPIASVERSFKLTKGHVNEMLGALTASVAMGSWGLLFGAMAISPLTGRYSDLRKLEETNGAKPPVHWLNYLYILFIIPVILFVVLITRAINISHTSTPYNVSSGASSSSSSLQLPSALTDSNKSTNSSTSTDNSAAASGGSSSTLQPTLPGQGQCNASKNYAQIAISGNATCTIAESIVSAANGSNYSSNGYSCTATLGGSNTEWSSYWKGSYYIYSCSNGNDQVAFNWQ